MANSEATPQIVIDLGEDLVTVKVKMRGAERINARILQRILREIQRTRRQELKKLIHKEKLSEENYSKLHPEKEVEDGRRGKKRTGKKARKTGGDDSDLSRLAEEVGRNI